MATLREIRDSDSDDIRTQSGDKRPLDLAFVDAGEFIDVICDFTKESPRWRASLGPARYREQKASAQRRPGFEFYDSYQPKRKMWIVQMHVDYWKEWVHQRFMTEPQDGTRRGTLTLWGDSPFEHRMSETGNYANSICSEVYKRERFEEGKGAKEGWHKVHKENHYFDCTVGACCAAAALGVRLMGDVVPPKRKQKRKKAAKKGNPRLREREGGWVKR